MHVLDKDYKQFNFLPIAAHQSAYVHVKCLDPFGIRGQDEHLAQIVFGESIIPLSLSAYA